MTNFIIGLGMGVLGIGITVALIASMETNRKLNRLTKKLNADIERINKQQKLIMNEMAVDFNKQKQS